MDYSMMYGYYRTRKFTDIYPTVEDFITDFSSCNIKIPLQNENNETITNLYYILYARYGNSHIASFDEGQFRYKLWSTVFMYGPTWEKRLQLQADIRAIAQEELAKGNSNVNNYAIHPDTAPSADATDPLSYITNQTYTTQKRGKLEALILQYNQLETDVTEDFIEKFKKLFLTVVYPEEPGWYVNNSYGGNN